MSSSSSADSGPSSSHNPSDYLRTANFSRSEGAAASPGDANLGDKLDYLLLDDDKKSELPGAGTAIPSRGWSDDLCYGTGTMYLSAIPVFASRLVFSLNLSPYLDIISAHPSLGLALGGAWGVREGARRPLAVSNTRLRINSVLNSVTRRGTFIGNSAGVLALLYNGVNSSIDAMRGKHDTLGSMGAGAVTGALFKSTAGVKPAIAAAAFMSGMAGVWSYVKKSV
ncbi:Tim17/Tim22/Tim23/Pmp24 family-domain-containing protein [Lyophyllum atratum]|nr:Tim17/Tim22/Tim23/Pmp24 family-domain-containing protein [Lyophyllum atratum]